MTVMWPLQSIDVVDATEPGAIIVIGVLALLLWAAIQFRNPAGAVMWGLSVMMLVASGLLGLRAELFWLAVLLTTMLIIVGIAVRLMRS